MLLSEVDQETKMLQAVRNSDALNPKYRSYFRLVKLEDAEFICVLRTDPQLNVHLNASPSNIEQQRQWLARYKAREAEGSELYFVIVSDSQDRGVVRMYDFRSVEGQNSFCWGSWIIPPPRVPGLVTFSAILVYELGFDVLQFESAHFDVRKANSGVIAFHERAGAILVAEDKENLFFRYTPAAYTSFRQKSAKKILDHRRSSSPITTPGKGRGQ